MRLDFSDDSTMALVFQYGSNMSVARLNGEDRLAGDPQARVKAWRKKQEGRRLDGFVNSSASWRLRKLAETWGCSIAGVVERLAIEADEKYETILFPETEYCGK